MPDLFAGRDVSRSLALNSFEEEHMREPGNPIDELEDLNDEQKESLNGWIDHFSAKYPVVGDLVDG